MQNKYLLLVLAVILATFTSSAVVYGEQTPCDVLEVQFFNSAVGPLSILDINIDVDTSHVYDVAEPSPPFNPAATYYFLPTFHPGLDANYTLRVLTGVEQSGTAIPPVRKELVGLSATCIQMELIVSAVEYLPLNSNRTCTYIYMITVGLSGCVLGDPQFHGLRGQSFQVHGIDGAIYNLISAPTYSVNSQFKFLSAPENNSHYPCPVMPSTGKRSVACWTHPGSYLGNLAVVTAQNERILLESGDHARGFAAVIFSNGMTSIKMHVGETKAFSEGVVHYNTTHEVTIELGAFSMYIENNHNFVNLARLHVADLAGLGKGKGTHGLIGQTWNTKRYPGQKIPEIEGDVDDYAILSDNLFDPDFLFTRFDGK